MRCWSVPGYHQDQLADEVADRRDKERLDCSLHSVSPVRVEMSVA